MVKAATTTFAVVLDAVKNERYTSSFEVYSVIASWEEVGSFELGEEVVKAVELVRLRVVGRLGSELGLKSLLD